jgi:alginate O-acetyltransferase complex protein AlgI
VVFSSVAFLFYFLPITVAAYLLAPQRAQNAVLLIASLIFYTWGGGAMVLLLFVSIFVDYICGKMAGRAYLEKNDRRRKLAVTLSLVANLGLLGTFKYANFVVAQLNHLGAALGLGTIAWTSIALPIGISFFTFQSMSYTLDVARGRVEPVRNLLRFSLFVALFPQLVAGPIVRYRDIAEQIAERHPGLEDVARGALRFAHGLVKKVVVADAAGAIADGFFGLPSSHDLTTVAAWTAVAAYTVQIYFDFSGYSDMAIGLGRVFGFRFPENFDRPYSAVSITDFWRRWHMTLSSWFRDYLYIPLGGSRKGEARTYLNLAIVFVLCGFWHGANWTFLVWGIYHGLLLVGERALGLRALEEAPRARWLRRGITLLLVMVGWVLFRSTSLTQAGDILQAMFSLRGLHFSGWEYIAFTHREMWVMGVGMLVVFLPGSFVGGRFLQRDRLVSARVARILLLVLGLPYALLLVASGSFSPFLYFQF